MNVTTTKGKDSHSKADQKTSKLVSKVGTGIVGENTKSLTCCKERNSAANCEPGSLVIKQPLKIHKATRKVSGDASSRSKTSDVQKSNSTPHQRPTDTRLDTQNLNDSVSGQPMRPNLKVGYRVDQSSTRQRNIDKLPPLYDATGSNKNQRTVYDVDSMSSDDIRDSLSRLSAHPIEPFTFLTDVMIEKATDESDTKDAPDDTDLTDIDNQLASLVRRVKLNRILLERANKKVKDINLLTESSRMMALRSLNYADESFSKPGPADGTTSVTPELPTISHPEINELKKTMNSTIEMLDYVHNMSTGDLIAADLPPELMEILAESTKV